MQESAETADKSVCTDEGSPGGGAAQFEAVLVSLVEHKTYALRREQARRQATSIRNHPLLLLLRILRDRRPVHVPYGSDTSLTGTPVDGLPQHWCEYESQRTKQKTLQLQGVVPEELEMERRRRRRRRKRRAAMEAAARTHKRPRTLLVSAIDEQAKVIHVLDPDELPRRARYTIMVTACLLLFLCLLLVGVTLRMAPLIDDMGKYKTKCSYNQRDGVSPAVPGQTQAVDGPAGRRHGYVHSEMFIR